MKIQNETCFSRHKSCFNKLPCALYINIIQFHVVRTKLGYYVLIFYYYPPSIYEITMTNRPY